jgi:hypothetical protein
MISVSGESQLQSTTILPTIIPASSEATNIAKYINYPVEYCNGLVKIEIPLFELRAGDIILPVSLSYHASGLKVNENSGIIGSGWTLNAEPLLKYDESYFKSAIPRHRIELKRWVGPTQETINTFIGDTDRDADEEHMKSGVLSFIRSPTGGQQSFKYEANRFNYYGSYGIAGGLRIESIEDYDPVTHQKLTRRFKYGEDENGCGFINHLPTPNDYMVLRTRRYDVSMGGNITVRTRTYSSWALSDLFRSSGSPVIYGHVTEYRESNEQSTRILYTYNVIDDNLWWDRNPEVPFPSDNNSENWMFYKLVNKSVFDNDKQSFIETNFYQYNAYKGLFSEYVPNRKVYYNEDYMFVPSEDNYPEIIEYTNPISMGCLRLGKEIITKDGVTEQTTYVYQNTTNLQQVQGILGASTIQSLAVKDNLTLTDINLLNQLRTQLPEAMVSTYSYTREGRLATETDPSGKKINYDYEYR